MTYVTYMMTGGGWGDSPYLCKALWVPRKALYKCK